MILIRKRSSKEKEAENERHKKLYKCRREEAIEALGGKCSQCGSSNKLEFDHIDPIIKTYHIHAVIMYSQELWEKELKKCQLLCISCHAKKSNIKAVCKRGHELTINNLNSKKRCMPCARIRSQEHRNRKKINNTVNG